MIILYFTIFATRKPVIMNQPYRYLISIVLLLLVFFACRKEDEQINQLPVSDFNFIEQIDSFILVSRAIDLESDSLTYEWVTTSSEITIKNHDCDTASFTIPEITEPIDINIEHTVCDETDCNHCSKTLRIPVLNQIRKWGLGITQSKELSNDVDHEWYYDQGNSGKHSGINCGPTAVTMAIKWTKKEFSQTPEDARKTYRPNGGWWYTSDIINYLNDHSVNHYVIELNNIDQLATELENGNIIILCLDMYYIGDEIREEWRINKFYPTGTTGWGHFIVIKGYRLVDNQLFYEVYDPNSFDVRYADKTIKGKNRYYKNTELDVSTNIWWNYAIVISKSKLKKSVGVDADNIIHQWGK